MSYKKTTLSIIKKSGILEDNEFNSLDDLKDELKDTFLHCQVFRTRTEMEASVLNDLKFPTPDAKYWQSVREQNVMFHELVMLSYEYRKNIIEIEKLKENIGKMNNEYDEALNNLEIEKMEYLALNQTRTAQDRIREIKEWHDIKKKLKPDMKYSLEDCDEHQIVSYTKRWIGQFMAMKEKGSPSERANLIGQLDKGLKICEQKGILDKVLPENEDERKMFLTKTVKI